MSKEYDIDSSESCHQDNYLVGVGLYQLLQHLKAFQLLCRKQGGKPLPELSEVIIKKAHEITMKGLKTEEGRMVNAGKYRKISVHAGQHTYPSHECIPENMEENCQGV